MGIIYEAYCFAGEPSIHSSQHRREPVEDPAHECRLALDYYEPAVSDLVAERRPAAHPKSSPARLQKLVSDSFACKLSFELCERK